MLNEIPCPKIKKFLGVALALEFDLATGAMTMGWEVIWNGDLVK